MMFDIKLGTGIKFVALLKKETDTSGEVDEAYLQYKWREGAAVSFSIGQMYVPFGNFDSSLISDPLALETAEIHSRAVLLNWKNDDISTMVYYGGDSEQDNLPQHYGLTLTFGQADEWVGHGLSLSYLSHLGAATGVRDSLNNPSLPNHAVPAIAVSGRAGDNRIRYIAEYIRATGRFAASNLAFAGNGASPSVFSMEIDLKTRAFKQALVFSLAYQGTGEALAMGLPQARLLTGASTELGKNTSLSLEWARDHDYSTTVGGTGGVSNTYSVQVSFAM